MKKIISLFVHLVDFLSQFFHSLSDKLVAILLCIISYSVVMRYLFNSPPLWSEEISCYCLAAIVLLPSAEVLRQGHHINLDLVFNRLPLRGQTIVNIIISTIGLFYCTVVAWFGAKLTIQAFHFNYRASTFLGTPRWVPISIIFMGMTVFSLQYLFKLVRSIRLLSNKEREKV